VQVCLPLRSPIPLMTRSGFAKAGTIRGQHHQVGPRAIGMDLLGSFIEHAFRFAELGVRHATEDGAHGLAGLVIVEPDAFGTEVRIDDVEVVAFGDGLVGAFWFTRPAIDAFVGDVRRHRTL